MSTRFLHTSDWQLGVTRHFLGADAQARWAAARFEAIRRLGRLALAERCEFIVVAGDVFESSQVDRRTVGRACEAMAGISLPIYLLPGNHDVLDAGSVYASRPWRERRPAHVQVLDRFGEALEVRPGVEVAGAPWTSKRPLTDLVADAGARLAPAPGVLRVLVGHGIVDTLSPDRDNPAVISVAGAEAAMAAGRYHYLALGDRHSLTAVGASGRIHYSGTHEAYDFGEVDPGKVLVVELSAEGVKVTPHQTGTWRFMTHEARLSSSDDVEALARHLGALADKERTLVKLGLVGTLGLAAHARLEAVQDEARDLFAALVQSGSRSDLAVLPEGTDFEGLSLAGFAAKALDTLRAQAAGGGAAGDAAADALALMVRLAGRAP